MVSYRIYRGTSSWDFHLYAANTEELGIKAHEDYARVERELGHVPVRDFSLPHGVDPEKVFAALFKRFSIETIRKGIRNLEISVTGGDDLAFGDISAEQ